MKNNMNFFEFVKLVDKLKEITHVIGNYSDCDGYGYASIMLSSTIKVDVSTVFGEITEINLDCYDNKTDEIQFSINWENKISNIYGPDFDGANKLIEYAKNLR